MFKVKIFSIILCAFLFGISGVAQAVNLVPVDVTRLHAYGDSAQGTSPSYDLDDDVDSWNVTTDLLGSPSATAAADPISTALDGFTLSGFSSFATAESAMTDAGGWTTFDSSDTFELFVNNQATGDTQYPQPSVTEGWGYSVSYALVTYDTVPSGDNLGDFLTVEMDIDFLSGALYAGGGNDEYMLDIGYALGTGITDYDPVVFDPANNPNPGLGQFDNYESWNANGFSWVSPSFSDSLEYKGFVGDQVQVLLAMSSFSYSYWGYTWTDGTLTAGVNASSEPIPEPTTMALFGIGLVGLAGAAARRKFKKEKKQ